MLFTLLTTFIYAPYFANAVAPDPVRGQALWGFATAAAGFVIALSSPVLGAIADASGRRKPWIAAFGVVLVIATATLWFGKPRDPSSIPIVLTAFAFALLAVEFATVFNNAMMPSLASPERMGRLSGLGWAIGYVGGILSLVVMLGWLVVAWWLLVPRTPITLRESQDESPHEPRLLAVSVLLFVLFVVALDKGWLPWGLALVLGAYAVWRPRLLLAIDWTLLAIIGLMFIDLRQLAALPALASWASQLPIGEGWRAYLAAVATSQFISNVPAAILLERYVHDLPALAAGVSVGGFGCVIGSLANLIALRLARLPNGLAEFHRISIPFLLACTASGLLVLRP